jgi:hypothetical protein
MPGEQADFLFRRSAVRQREQLVVRTMHRVREFVAHGPTEMLHVQTKLLPRLERQLDRLDAMAVEQELGMRLQKAATRKQAMLAKALRESFVLPLAQVAAALDDHHPAMRASLRAPHKRIPRERLVRAAQSMANAAQRFEREVNKTLGTAFLREMHDAADALERSLLARHTPTRRHIQARAAVEREIQNARTTVRLMNALLDSSLRQTPALLAAWRKIRRYGV